MKIFILFLFLSISPIELRRHNDDDDMYELDDLFKNNYNRPRHHSNKQYIPDETDDDRYIPSSFQQEEKVYPSRKKVLNENDYQNEDSDNDDGTNRLILSTTTTGVDQDEQSDSSSSCINKYDTTPEQLVKVKELKNGARMIRTAIIDKRSLPHNLKVKDSCMIDCCQEKTCDLAMLSEQPTEEGYKCYLFACNGSCPLASHQHYTIMTPKKDSVYYTTLVNRLSTTTISDVILSPKTSIFLETSVILFLVFGIICTILLFILLFYYCRASRKRGHRLKNYAVDADYLINGLYL